MDNLKTMNLRRIPSIYFLLSGSKKNSKEKEDNNSVTVSENADYDGLEYENPSNFNVNQEQTETTPFQNPYYQSSGDININDKSIEDVTSAATDVENVKIQENPYYGEA